VARQWFRMYAEAVDDEKLRLLAFEDRWHFVAILCLKCMGTLDSDAPHLERRIALKLGLQMAELDKLKSRLVEVHLISDDWTPIKWDARQFESDVSTERVRAFRKSKETFQKRFGSVSETPQNRTEQNRTDTPVSRVFSHWRKEFDHPKAQLDPKRTKTITDALKVYAEADLIASISGYKNSPYHMGKNDSKTVYDDIALFLRDAKHIDAGLAFAKKPEGQGEWM
jgi:hypothetical protein